jgi:hypothetical protein
VVEAAPRLQNPENLAEDPVHPKMTGGVLKRDRFQRPRLAMLFARS